MTYPAEPHATPALRLAYPSMHSWRASGDAASVLLTQMRAVRLYQNYATPYANPITATEVP
jgi:hypothetical protein